MLVQTFAGDRISFGLRSRAIIEADDLDATLFHLEYNTWRIVFKAGSLEAVMELLQKLPAHVLKESTANNHQQQHHYRHHHHGPQGHQLGQVGRKKGQSVEDLLEGRGISNIGMSLGSPGGDNDPLFSPQTAATSLKKRAELVDNWIRVPVPCVRRVKQLCKWVTSLHLNSSPIQILTLHRDFCTGLLLADMVKLLLPEVSFVHLNRRALTKKSALSNLEQALGAILRSKACATRIPSAEEVYCGNTSKISIMLDEVFALYVHPPLYKGAIKMLKWFQQILKQYSRRLPESVFEEGDLSVVWPFFQSGVSIFCVIYHIYGPSVIGEGVEYIQVKIGTDVPSYLFMFNSLLCMSFFLTLLLVGVGGSNAHYVGSTGN